MDGWGEGVQHSFDHLKAQGLFVFFPSFGFVGFSPRSLWLTDASGYGIGAILMQNQRPIPRIFHQKPCLNLCMKKKLELAVQNNETTTWEQVSRCLQIIGSTRELSLLRKKEGGCVGREVVQRSFIRLRL